MCIYRQIISNLCGVFLSIRHRFFLPLTCFWEGFRLPHKVSLGGACDQQFFWARDFWSLLHKWLDFLYWFISCCGHFTSLCYWILFWCSFVQLISHFFLVLPHWDFSMSRIDSALSATSTLGSSWKASWPTLLRLRLMSESRPWEFWILSQSPSSSSSGSSTMSVQWMLGWKGWPIVFSSSEEAMNSESSNIPSTTHGKLQAGTCTADALALLLMLHFRIHVLLSLFCPLSLNY